MSGCCWASASCSSPPGRGASRKSRPNVLLVTLLVLAQHPETRAIVYTTAESTSFRLTPTDTLVFKPSEADRKSTRLNSSHSQISYAVFCLKKKTYMHSA